MTDTTSTTINRILPKRLPNSAYRVREYLTEKEVDRLIEAAKRRGRNDQRDAAAILLAYRHGLRATELCSLRWSQIDLRNGRLHVNRAKGGRCTDLNCEQSTARYTALAPDRCARAEVSPPIEDRFDAWPASARSFARCHTDSTRERTQAGAAAIRSS
jgi:integrase